MESPALEPGTVLPEFERHATDWLASLDTYTPEQFLRKSSEAEWSLGQMYVHIVSGTNWLNIQMIHRCLRNDGEMNQPMKDEARGVFEANAFPPIRIAVPPSPHYTPAQPESIEAIRGGLEELIGTMRDIAPQVAAADPGVKAPHPFFGPLNAREWYQLAEMHIRHHGAQKKRLEEEPV